MFSYYVYEKPGKESYGTVEWYHTGKGIGILLAEVLLLIFNLLFLEQTPEAKKESQKSNGVFKVIAWLALVSLFLIYAAAVGAGLYGYL